MQFRVWLLSVLCVVSGVSAQPNLLETAIAPVAVATKNIACTYVVGDVSGKVQKRVHVSADALRWFKAFSKKEDFAQRIKRGENAAATELKLLFAANKSDVIALMAPETDDSFFIHLIVAEKNTKKVVIYGSAPTCPEWIVALVDAAAIAAQSRWTRGKIGVGVGVVGVLAVGVRSFRRLSSTSTTLHQQTTQDDLSKAAKDSGKAKQAADDANAWFNSPSRTAEKRQCCQNVVDSIKAFTPFKALKSLNPSYFPHVFNYKQVHQNRTTVHEAAMIGNTDCLKFMAEKGANFNIQDSYDKTPAHYAAEQGDEAALLVLKDGGANFNIQDRNGWTPAHDAANNQKVEALQALRDCGADFSIKDQYGKSVDDLIAEKELVLQLV